MHAEAVIVMIFLFTLSWGGFLYCLLLAMKKEQRKKNI